MKPLFISVFVALLSVGCSGETKETGAPDGDGDGYSAAEDCDDGNAAIHPGATEVCDGVDNNCENGIDEDTAEDAATWYADSDGDNYGNAADSVNACEAPADYVSDHTDCDDSRDDVRGAFTHPDVAGQTGSGASVAAEGGGLKVPCSLPPPRVCVQKVLCVCSHLDAMCATHKYLPRLLV